MKRARRSSLLVAAVVAILLWAAPAFADLAPRWSDEQFVEFSEVILSGRVDGVTTAWDEGSIYTYVTVSVRDVLKGWVPERQIVLKQLGGERDGMALDVLGQARFTPGEEALLFLEVRPRDRSLYTTALDASPVVNLGAESSAFRIPSILQLDGLPAPCTKLDFQGTQH